MPVFSQRSLARLATCHPDLQTLLLDVIKTHDCTILEGARPREKQAEYRASGRSKVSWPNSNHNVDGVRRTTSWAVDVAPYPIDWHDHARFVAFARYVLATAKALRAQGRMTYEVRWGGDWDRDGDHRDERFFDGPHFELLGVPDGQ